MSLTYIKNKSGPRIEPWGTTQDTDAGREKLLPKLRSVHHDQLCQRPFEDQLESCQSSNHCQSPLKLCHSNKKSRNL